MSVTFTFARWTEDPRFGTVLMCGTNCRHTCTLPEPCEDARLYDGYCDHADAAEAACGCTAFDVQMSNTNAVMVLERLGLPADPADLAGHVTAADLLGRAMTGNVGRDDSGIATVSSQEPGGPRWVECGVSSGYFGERLGALARLATEAMARDELVAWA